MKRFQSWHGAKVVFMNGTRMGASWCNHMDGVHLLTEIYREEAAAELAGHMRARFFVAPHFVDSGVFLPPTPQQRLALRRQWGIPEAAFVILTVGPFSQVGAKRLDHLASEVAAAPPCVLLHAGVREEDSAAFEEKLRSLLSSRLIVLGPVDRHKIVSLYQAADIYSLAALEEPFSIAILEAMACGLPVVHHPFPVTRWITGSGGAPVSMQEPGAAAAVFRNLHQNPGLVEELSRAARHEAVSRFSPWEIARCIRQHLAIIAGAPNP
ncbi:glycosyltransferase family 4 protein [Oscillatoria amoena NRMC-F 0135]|nr:glycosyltransferase family 4 protein [Oscillatoria amoena NRMC-F 0135]